MIFITFMSHLCTGRNFFYDILFLFYGKDYCFAVILITNHAVKLEIIQKSNKKNCTYIYS